MTNNITFNQINDMLSDFSDRHKQINSYYFGDIVELDKIETFKYPLFAAIPTDSRLTKGIFQHRLSIICGDIIKEDKSNEVEVLSDTMQILTDFISEINNDTFYNDNDITVQTDAVFVPFYERFNDIIAGWVLNIQINVLYRNSCIVPTTDKTSATITGICNE